MTTSISNARALTREQAATGSEPKLKTEMRVEIEPTLANRFIFLTLCVAIVLSTLAYGTVHNWSLAFFELSAALIVSLWAIDGWQSGVLRLSRNALQWPLIGLFILGLTQLLSIGGATGAGTLSAAPVKSLSLDPYSTRLVLVQLAALSIYFSAALSFIDSPARLRLIARTITIFGFALAIFGLTQSFTSPTKIYWTRELTQSTAFGPFINRHHFAGYMELTMAVPLGLLFSGAVERDKRLLYIFAAAMMGIALITTGSRGGIISLIAELIFLVALTSLRRKQDAPHAAAEESGRVRGLLLRAGLTLVLISALFAGVVMFGGEAALSRFVGTVNADDPTTGRAHFWSVAVEIIRDHPFIGAGLGSFGLAYTRYDSRNGLFRLEQAHNDYLQVLTDAGIVGAALGLFFIVVLFRKGFARCETEDLFRRGVAAGALAGCFAVLVHSFFDFTLHTTSNALLFLIVAALATLNGRVERVNSSVHRRRRRSHSHTSRERSAEATAQEHPGAE